MNNFEEKKISTKKVYQGRVIDLNVDKVLCPNGRTSTREVVNHHGGAGVLAIKDNKVLLEKQFRYAFSSILYEIPAGKLEKDESPFLAAARELEEETGYKPKSIHKLIDIYPSVGYTNEIIYLFYADELIESKTNLDDDEMIETNWFTFAEVKDLIDKNIIKDAKTIIAIEHYMLIKGIN